MTTYEPPIPKVETYWAICTTCGSKSPLTAKELDDQPQSVSRLCRECDAVKAHTTHWGSVSS